MHFKNNFSHKINDNEFYEKNFFLSQNQTHFETQLIN